MVAAFDAAPVPIESGAEAAPEAAPAATEETEGG
jgi:hypothetical protein